MENTKFRDLIEDELLFKAVDELGFESPTDIQALTIPKIKSGIDIIGQAQTGTGKTFSYAIPLVEKINPDNKKISALILCPTRELSIQVANEFDKLLTYNKKIKTAIVYGGESYEKQFRALKKNPQIIIGTPGRIIDHLERKTISFDALETLVLDEADEMLKMGFQEDLERILKGAPEQRQTVLFSATIPPFIHSVTKKYQKNPELLKVAAKSLTVDRIKQKVYFCYKESKQDLLIRLLDYYNLGSCMIFCNTKAMVDELVMLLQKYNYSVDGLHGDLKQLSRDRVMNAYRHGAVSILIATDVAARGLDINNIEGVINYDLPTDNEVYVHRIGRTGRAGKEGLSLSIATPRQNGKVNEICHFTKSKMEECKIPTVEEIKQVAGNNIYVKLRDGIATSPMVNNDNLVIVNKLMKDGYDAYQIINALVEYSYKDTAKEYPEIQTFGRKPSTRTKDSYSNRDGRSKDRDGRSSGRNSSEPRTGSRSKDFVLAHLNIGKNESVRPPALLAYLKEKADVRKDNVGDIVIRKSGTTIQITKPAYSYLVRLNGKSYNDKKIVVTKVKSMEENK